MGNLIGDMINYSEMKEVKGLLRSGVLIHRKIDSFTDGHASMFDIKAELRKRHGKYAPVVLDILLDRILVENWNAYCEDPYESFADWVYAFIAEEMSTVPGRVQSRLERMVEGRWLLDYSSIDRFRRVLEWTDRRARFDSYFAQSLEDLDLLRPQMSIALQELMSDLQPAVQKEMDSAILRNGGR